MTNYPKIRQEPYYFGNTGVLIKNNPKFDKNEKLDKMKEILKFHESKENKHMQSYADSRNVTPMETFNINGSAKKNNTSDFKVIQKIDSSVNRNSYFNKSKRKS